MPERLNTILWLKCRLTLRSHQASRRNVVGTVLILATTAFMLVPMALVVGGAMAGMPDAAATEATHLVLGLLYLGWIALPVMGYRLQEFFDVTRLVHFPISAGELFAAAVLSTFLDVTSFGFLPILAGLAIAYSTTPASFFASGAVLFTFLAQTFAMAQLALFALTHVLNSRRVSELLLIIFPPLLFVCVVGAQIVAALRFPALSLADLPPPSDLSGFLPCGVTANALRAIAGGAWGMALYHELTLLAATAVTVLAGGAITERMLQQCGPFEMLGAWIARWFPSRRPGAEEVTRRPRAGLIARLAARVLGGPQLQALASKELRLMLREPQVRMSLGFYLVSTLLLTGVAATGTSHESAPAILPMMSFSAVFLLSGVVLNSIALEREGLKFLLAAPVTPAVVLAGNNIGHWLLISSVSAACLAVTTWAYRIAWPLLLGHLYVIQTLLFLLMGLGNLASVLVPYRLPAKGVQPKQATGGGQAFLVFVLASVATTLSMMMACVAVLLALFPAIKVDAAVIAVNLPLSSGSVLGAYAACTALAAWILEHRREALLREVVD